MIKTIQILLSFMLFHPLSSLKAQESPRFSIRVSEGLHQQYLDWSIAGNIHGENPNIYSELIWHKMRGNSTEIQVGYRFWKQFKYQATAEKTFIRSGKVSDQDYANDNRLHPVFSAFLDSNKGYSWRIENQVSYIFCLKKDFTATAEIGYSISRESFFLTDDNFSVANKKLNSNYKTKWNGITAGLNAEYLFWKKWSVIGKINYHSLNYNAVADWNIIEDFAHPKSFTHQAKANAWGFNIAPKYKLHKHLFLYADWSYLRSKAKKGVDQLFLTSGQHVFTKLNGVNRMSERISLGMQIVM